MVAPAVQKKRKNFTGSTSLDNAIYDASRVRSLEYPESSAAEQRSLAGFTPTLCCSLLFFLLSFCHSYYLSLLATRSPHIEAYRHGDCRLRRVYQAVTAICNARNPIPPEGASESDKNRLFELCGLSRREQKGKDSLHARFKLAKLKGAYYTKDKGGNKCQILKNSEFLVAQCLLSESSCQPTVCVYEWRSPIVKCRLYRR